MSRRFILCAAALLAAFTVQAQRRPYEDAIEKNLWLVGSNVAGLRQNTDTTISYVDLYSKGEKGGFHRYGDADFKWNAGAEARTVKHLERFSMIGGFSFDQMNGKDMFGSMFVDPGYYPIDALEFTPGAKKLQKYAFDGGVAIDLTDRIVIGANIDFGSSNYSKRKDLRFTDYRLDLEFSPGISYNYGDGSIGLNYIFRKNSEYTDPEQIGTGESSYYAFLDKGLSYGRYEVWTGSGVHLDEAGVQGLPLREQFHGIGLQTSAYDNYYFDVEYLYGSGVAGEKQFVWYRFPSHSVNCHLVEKVEMKNWTLYLHENWSYKAMKNNETIIEKVTENGVTTTVEYGQNQILDRFDSKTAVSLDLVGQTSRYGLYVSTSERESTSSLMYPYVVEQFLVNTEIGLSGAWKLGRLDLLTDCVTRFGKLSEDERMVDEESGVESVLYRNQDYFDAFQEYETATRVGGSASLRYNFKRGVYLQASGSAVHAFGIKVLGGSSRCSFDLHIGMNF